MAASDASKIHSANNFGFFCWPNGGHIYLPSGSAQQSILVVNWLLFFPSELSISDVRFMCK